MENLFGFFSLQIGLFFCLTFHKFVYCDEEYGFVPSDRYRFALFHCRMRISLVLCWTESLVGVHLTRSWNALCSWETYSGKRFHFPTTFIFEDAFESVFESAHVSTCVWVEFLFHFSVSMKNSLFCRLLMLNLVGFFLQVLWYMLWGCWIFNFGIFVLVWSLILFIYIFSFLFCALSFDFN